MVDTALPPFTHDRWPVHYLLRSKHQEQGIVRLMANSSAGWHNRATILAEFTNQLAREASVEDLAIEWSSSDEEVIQPTCPLISDDGTELYSSVNKDHNYDACKLSAPVTSDQNSSSVNIKKQISTQQPSEVKESLNTSCVQVNKNNIQDIQGFLPLSKHHDFHINEIKTDNRRNESIPLGGRCFDETSSYPSTSGVSVLEPQSPVLGSRRVVAGYCSPIVRARKAQIKISSPILGSCMVPKRKLNLSDAASLKRQTNQDSISGNWTFSAAAIAGREQDNVILHHIHIKNDDLTHSTITRNQNHAHEVGFHECSQLRVEQDVVAKSPNKRNDYVHTPSRECNGENLASRCSVDHHSEEIFQFGSYGTPTDSKASDLSLSKENPGMFIDECASQSIGVPSEGINSQLNHSIEIPLTPCKTSVNRTDISEDSESSELQAAFTAELLGQDANTRSGFDWVKHLQTPQKLMNSESSVDGVESSKKKFVKDGHAQHLKHVLMSWRSCITVWSHELSVTELLGTPPKQSPSLLSKMQHYTTSTGGEVKLEPQGKLNEVKQIYSPSVKNLQEFLIENPTRETTLWPRKVSRKYLDLRLIDVGGQLPGNAALCEAVGSNVKKFQTSVEIKKEDAEETDPRKFEKFLVFFALDEHNITSLYKFDTVRVYATWQNLSVSAHDVPVIFTSYFKFHIREEGSTSFPMGCRRILHTWPCSCQDKAVDVSQCGAELCAFSKVSSAHAGYNLPLDVRSGFTIIEDTPDTPPQNDKLLVGTILEALEKCGGVSAVPVSITIRIHRIITNSETPGSVQYWELVGQDAAGQFCVVKVPNWPLAEHLMEAFDDSSGNHSTHTLTYLTMTQRITNTQNPGLFSLLTSLHNAYQRSVLRDPLLQPVLQDPACCPPQTHCYVLTVSLGMTTVHKSGEQVTFPIKLPQWSLQEALRESHDGQRGSLVVYVLYKTSSSLHVMNPISHAEGSPRMFCIGKEKEEAKPQENLFISRVLLMRAALPPKISERGPVMQCVVLKDVVMWHGSVVVDEYSFIEVQDDGSTKIDSSVLNQALSPLSSLTQQDSLTLVSGTIIKIEEENAFLYFICGKCKSDKVQETGNGRIDCLDCGQKSAHPCRGFFLEVWLDCGCDIQQATVKVKLYYKTIKKLLQAYCGSQEEKYCATALLGHEIGPMACILLQLQKPRRYSICTYSLAELPY